MVGKGPFAIEARAAAWRVGPPSGVGGLHPLKSRRQQGLRCRFVGGVGRHIARAAYRLKDGPIRNAAAGFDHSQPVGDADEAVELGHGFTSVIWRTEAYFA